MLSMACDVARRQRRLLRFLGGRAKEVVAVYLISNRRSSRRIVWHGSLDEHPYHAFGRSRLKAEDDAGGWLGDLRPAISIQASKVEVRRLVHQPSIFGSE